MNLSERVNNISVSPTIKISGMAKKMKSEGKNVINLSVGEPDFNTPQNIKNAAVKAINENKTQYTINAGIPELRKAISSKLKTDNNVEFKIDEIIVSSGAKQSLYNALQVIANPNDEVLIPIPYWVSYPQMVKLAGAKPVFLSTDESTGFKITVEQLNDVINENTKAIILCNPSNPSGAAYSKAELLKIAEFLFDKDIYVISDEIYEKLTYGEYQFNSFVSLIPEMRDKIITINGVSKAYAMTGWRIGFAAAQKGIVQAMNKIQSHSTSNANSVAQYAALEAFSGNQDSVNSMKIEFEKRRNYLFSELKSIEGISCYKPQGAFYLFPNISVLLRNIDEDKGIKNSYDFAMDLLENAEVATVPGSSFGAEGYLRLSYATSMENLKEAVIRIRNYIDTLNK